MRNYKNCVLIDDQIFRKQIVGGISNYFIALFENSGESTSPKLKLGVFLYKTRNLKQHVGSMAIRYNRRVFAIVAISLNCLKMFYSRGCVIHSTFYSKWSFALISAKLHIVTIHDMIPEDFPEFFTYANPNRYKSKYIKDANGIIVVSNSTYQRLFFHFPEISCPVRVIPLASKYVYKNQELPELINRFNSKRIVYVGPRNGHKNFETLVRAFSKLKICLPEISLICIGGGGFNSYEFDLFNALKLNNAVSQTECSDEDLEICYQESALLICPSVAEGFGLPSVEAASLFTPVIVGKTSYLGDKLPEDLVIFDVYDVDEIVRKVLLILTNIKLYQEAAEVSHKAVRDLSWAQTASMTRDFYRFVIEQSNHDKAEFGSKP